MKSFVLSLVLLLGLGAAGAGSATAAVPSEDREMSSRTRAAALRDSGTHLQRQRVARASINDSDDYYGRSDRWQSSKSAVKKRYVQKKKHYAKRKGAHTAKYGKKSKRYAHKKSRKQVASTRRPRSLAASGPVGSVLSGIASFYWQPQRLATGGWFNPNAMTAAHKTLPFGTKVRVTHLANGKSVDVKINDRGPYIAGRIIDLSKAAAGVIGMQGQGIAKVKVTVLGREKL